MRPEFNPVTQAIADWLERNGQLEVVQAFYRQGAASLAILGHRLRIRFRPNDTHNYHRLGKALLQQERWQDAIRACRQAIELDPNSSWAYFTLGEASLGQGHWQEALQFFKQAVELDATVALFYDGLGKAQMNRENWDAAIAAFRQAIALDPNSFWSLYHLGEVLVKSGHWQEAISTLETATSLQSAFPWAYYYLGDALLAEERLNDAITAYQKAVQLRPNNPYINQSLSYALHLQEQEQKIATYCHQIQQQSLSDTGKLTILMITPYSPYPPKTGANARMFHELKCLGKKHQVVLVSLIFSKEDYHFETVLEEYCDLAVLTSIGDAPVRQPQEPKLVNRYNSKRLRKILQKLQSIPFDIVSCNFVYMGQYHEFFPNAFHVLAEHNIESELLKRSTEIQNSATHINQLVEQTESVRSFVEAEAEAQQLATYEDAIWEKFLLRTVVSDRDKQILDSRCSVGQTLVVNNGIDTQSVTLLSRSPQKRVLFIGTMSYYPNIDAATYFVESILPHIWDQDPTIQFWVAGAMPPPKITNLAQDSRINVIANPDDMSDVAKDCCLSIVPIRFGSGTRIKILHSMAMGLPVVSSSLGCEGLLVEDGKHLLIQDLPNQFAQAVLRLLADLDLQQTLIDNGRQLVEQKYDWNAIYEQAEKQYVTCFKTWQEQQASLAIAES